MAVLGGSRRAILPYTYTIVVFVALYVIKKMVASAVTVQPSQCTDNFLLGRWEVKRFGPVVICQGGSVTFRWQGMHGVFQIPQLQCPTNFTSPEAENYKFLAPTSSGGGYEWKVPEERGHYWATSQHQSDCEDGTTELVICIFGIHDI